MKIVVYPQQTGNTGLSTNPYIRDFVKAMTDAGVQVVNGPVRNPLIGMLPHCLKGDALVMHWLENVPDYKYGPVQTLCALAMLAAARVTGHTTVWFLHNCRSHATSHQWQKQFITRALMRHATLVVTHASQGVEVLHKQCPSRRSSAVWLHHPTKNRLDTVRQCRADATNAVDTDLLIWGTISPYKGVDKWLEFMKQTHSSLKVRIVGRCPNEALAHRLTAMAAELSTVHFDNRSLTFDELAAEVSRSRFVLVPYAAESVLSSGILMDSLSLGAKVIGPNVGSFSDYAAEPLLSVATFDTYADVERIVASDDGQPANLESYAQFLDGHDWAHFARELSRLIAETR